MTIQDELPRLLDELANDHTVGPPSALDDAEAATLTTRALSSTRWVSIAAACLLVGCLAGLVVIVQRSAEAPAPNSVAVSDSIAPTTTRAPVTSIEQVIAPLATQMTDVSTLADDAVPILENPPEGYTLNTALLQLWSTGANWEFGIEQTHQFAVVDEGALVTVVSAVDEAAPWQIASEGLLRIEDVGGDAAIDDDPGYEIVVRMGEFTRRFRDGSGALLADVNRDAIHEVASAVGDRSTTSVADTERVVGLPNQINAPTLVSYGSAGDSGQIQLRLLRFEDALNDVQVDLIAQGVTSRLSDQAGTVLEISPTELLVITAPTAVDLDAIDDDVTFVPIAESGLTRTTEADTVVARGEPRWGRWEYRNSTTDPSCWHVSLRMWDPHLGEIAGSGKCGGPAIPEEFCYSVGHDTYAGVFLDTHEPITSTTSGSYNLETEYTGDATTFLATPTTDTTPPVIAVGDRTLDCADNNLL